MIDEQVKRRIQNDFNYQSERLRNLFRTIYADPVKAWEKWEAYVQAHGFPKAELRFLRKPGRYGRQNGWLVLNFFPTNARRQREMAKREAARVVSQWGAAHLQCANMDARITEAKVQEAAVRSARETQSQERRTAREEQDSPERSR